MRHSTAAIGPGWDQVGPNLPVGNRRFPVPFDDGHPLAVDGMASDQVLDPSARRRDATDRPVADRQVGFLHVAVGGERLDESVHGGLRLGDDDESGRLLVEPVDDARTRDAADAAQVGAVEEERVHKRPGEVSGRGMDDQPGGLVDDEHVGVLEDNVERNVLGLRLGGDGWRDLDVDRVGLGDLHAGLFGDGPVHGHEAGLDEALDPRPGEVGVAREKQTVETFHRITPRPAGCRRPTSRSGPCCP